MLKNISTYIILLIVRHQQYYYFGTVNVNFCFVALATYNSTFLEDYTIFRLCLKLFEYYYNTTVEKSVSPEKKNCFSLNLFFV